jgi:hypothetical protein
VFSRLIFAPVAFVIVAGVTLAGCGQSPRLGSSTPGVSGTPYAAAPGNGGAGVAIALPGGAEDTDTLTPETRTIRVADLPQPGATPDVRNPAASCCPARRRKVVGPGRLRRVRVGA